MARATGMTSRDILRPHIPRRPVETLFSSTLRDANRDLDPPVDLVRHLLIRDGTNNDEHDGRYDEKCTTLERGVTHELYRILSFLSFLSFLFFFFLTLVTLELAGQSIQCYVYL
jgi:hypothetical protein